MICDKCKKNEAVVFYNESVNGQKKSLALCADCAAEAEKSGEISTFDIHKKMLYDPFEDMNSIFGSLFGIPQYTKKALSEAKRCNLCGAEFSDLVADGKVGCPECYKVFADELRGTIAKIHGTTSHSGVSPSRFEKGKERKKKIEALEAELKKAISEEEYERAATLRDEIRALKEEKVGEEL